MCYLKVANQGGAGGYEPYTEEQAGGGDGGEVPETMFSMGYSQSGELLAMVSALTHVISGDRGGAPPAPSGVKKREREEDLEESGILGNAIGRGYRGRIVDYRAIQSCPPPSPPIC